MELDAFSAGVKPGGLRSKQEIKVLICYLLTEIDVPVRKADITSVLQNDGFANYFEASEAFSELVLNDNIVPDEEKLNFYIITESGRMIAEQLGDSLPLTIKERAAANIKTYLERLKSENENKVSIKKNDRGYSVTCSISGGEFDLLSLTLYVPDMDAASTVKDNFYNDPGAVYQSVLEVLTKSSDLTSGLFNLI